MSPPAEWRTTRPSQEEIIKFRESQRKKAGEAADMARDFYVRFPKHDKADEAHKKEYELTAFAVQLGSTNRLVRLVNSMASYTRSTLMHFAPHSPPQAASGRFFKPSAQAGIL